jgi:hypothetical protein
LVPQMGRRHDLQRRRLVLHWTHHLPHLPRDLRSRLLPQVSERACLLLRSCRLADNSPVPQQPASSTTSASGTRQTNEQRACRSSLPQSPSPGACRSYLPRAVQLELTRAHLARSAFGGLIATGVSYLSGKAGLYGWQWLVSRRETAPGVTALISPLAVYPRRHSSCTRWHLRLVCFTRLSRVSPWSVWNRRSGNRADASSDPPPAGRPSS